MPDPESPPPTEISLTRKEKEKLLQQMYSLPHWIAIIRLFAYKTLPMDQARTEIKPIAEEFGKDKVAHACEALVEIVPGEEPLAKLKMHIRRMAFQMLGAEPPPSAVASPSAPKTEPQPQRKPRKPATASAPPAAALKTDAADRRSTIMQQYQAAKEKHPDMLLLFRMGDFYELFGKDAETAHTLLGLTLTTRDGTLTMAGFPHHQLEAYLHKLLRAGRRVAVCDQVDESLARGPIRREVTRVVTPGTMIEDEVPEPRKARRPEESAPDSAGRPLRQPRHFVLKRYQEFLNEAGFAFVAFEDVKRTTPAVAPYVGSLDFIVLRGEEKSLVTVRPNLQAKHLKAMGELQTLFGTEYKPVRIWPKESPDGWTWQEHTIPPPAMNS